MSESTSSPGDASVQHPIIRQLRQEAAQAAEHSAQAIASYAWMWPIKGLLFSIAHPQLILSVRTTFLSSLASSSLTFILLALLTYIPQAALLSLFTGPILGPLLAILLLGAESILILSLLGGPRGLLLEPALAHIFDSTLIAKKQTTLVREGKTKYATAAATTTTMRGTLHARMNPLAALGRARDGAAFKYLLSLPLNFIPIVGTVAFLFVNGQRSGPDWHARYFQLKGWDQQQRVRWVETKRAEYTAFGMAALFLTSIPLVGLVFSFTNTVGAALWAAEIEARASISTEPLSRRGSGKAKKATATDGSELSGDESQVHSGVVRDFRQMGNGDMPRVY